MPFPRSAIVLALVCGAASCVTYQDQLNRSQRHFEANEYERSLALLRGLEGDMDSLRATDRTRYAYLRGMTDFRMAYRADARHWLALARELERQSPGGLSEPWKARLDEALKELDQEVFDKVAAMPAPDGATARAQAGADAGGNRP